MASTIQSSFGTFVIPYAGSNLNGLADIVNTLLTDPNTIVTPYGSSVAAGPNVLFIDTLGGGVTAPGGGSFLVETGSAFVQGSGTNDNVVFGAHVSTPGASFVADSVGQGQVGVYIDNGGSNNILFAAGNNTYDGGSASGANTIAGGTGHDNIITGAAGSAVVFSGKGGSTINLDDTTAAAAGTWNDLVWSNDGPATVNAAGHADAFASSSDNNVISDGDTTGTGTLSITFAAGSDNNKALLNQTSVAGSTRLDAVFDSGANNLVIGGSAVLDFIAASGIGANIIGGSNTNYIFGNANDTINYTAVATAGNMVFVSGAAGGDNINASGSNANNYFNGSSDAAAHNTNNTLVGGSGTDIFYTAADNETLTGGAGNNFYFIDSIAGSAGANILITDFGGGHSKVDFNGYTDAQVAAALAGASTVTIGGSEALKVTLSDNTTVTFVGISSLTSSDIFHQ